MSNMNITGMVDALNSVANDYESSINDLVSAASASENLDMSQTVVQTTNISLKQAMLEMVQGSAKQIADQIKKQGSNVSR